MPNATISTMPSPIISTAHVIVIEPMPSNHGAFPYSNAQFFLGSRVCLPHPCFSYFDAKFFGFVVWGKNLASVSQFVTEIRPW
jgi:hypothetical protein